MIAVATQSSGLMRAGDRYVAKAFVSLGNLWMMEAVVSAGHGVGG
jgi:hypothetical protein